MTDADVEYRESKYAGLSLQKEYGEMTCAELRGSILRATGKTGRWRTPLTKDTLNSIYAYLTGEYVVSKLALDNPDHPEYHPRQYILTALVHEVPIGEPRDEWSSTSGDQPSQLRRDELQTLREEMADRDNQMPRPGPVKNDE